MAQEALQIGKLGLADKENYLIYKELSLPENAQVRYIKAGKENTTICASDGTVWSMGLNSNFEIGDGKDTNATVFTKAKTQTQDLENVIMIGKNNGSQENDLGGLNAVAIVENGDVYITGDNLCGQLGVDNIAKSKYYMKMGGKAKLKYEQNPVELTSNGEYIIDKAKLNYDYYSINVYTDEGYKINNLKFRTLDEQTATVDETGKITAKEVTSRTTKIEVEDIDNGFKTYITVIVNKLQDADGIYYIYNANDMIRFRNSVNNGENYLGKTVYIMADIDLSTVCNEKLGTWEPIGINGTLFEGTLDRKLS